MLIRLRVSRPLTVLTLALCLAGVLCVSPRLSAQAPADTPATAAVPAADAAAPANEFERWIGRLADAGMTVPIMALLSVLGVAVIIERAVRLRRSRVTPQDLFDRVQPLFRDGRYADITAACESSDSTLGRVIAYMVKHRDWPTSDLTLSAGDIASRELRRHLLRAYPLAIVGALAPLLGLLGTVSGMVDAFDAVAVAGLGDVGVLGSSISKALVTTMVGLVVAIPALFAYHFFKSRTQLYGVILEEECADLVNDWFMSAAARTKAEGAAATTPEEAADADARQA